jgi:hypothetical protein
MRIVLLSDTHGFLDPGLTEHLAGCDEIWHAGDVGSTAVLNALRSRKPLRVVRGNIDSLTEFPDLPDDLFFTCGGLNFWITHIAGAPPNYNTQIRQTLKEQKIDVLVCGHSHILRVVHDPKYKVMYLNPGACGNQGFHQVKTILRFSVDDGKLHGMAVVELGKRGALPPT